MAIKASTRSATAEFARRVKSRSPQEMEADATFKLAVWFQRNGDGLLAAKYFQRAQDLNPEDWNYRRQDWSFTPNEAQSKWLDKFKKDAQPYYPKLDMPQPARRPNP